MAMCCASNSFPSTVKREYTHPLKAATRRTCMECAFFGCYKGRWARTVLALNLGREFTDPFQGIGRKGKEVGDEVLCLCNSLPLFLITLVRLTLQGSTHQSKDFDCLS